MINVKLFQATEYPLEIYNGKALINLAMRFFTTDCDGNDDDFDFPDFESAYFRVYNERLGRQILSLVPSRSGSYLVLNETAETMTFEDNGRYYYEIGYLRSGGYEQALRFGPLKVI